MTLLPDILRGAGFDPADVKLLRHDRRGLQAWNAGRDEFLSFVSIQTASRSPFKRSPRYVAHFLPGPQLPNGGFTAYFAGMTELFGRWPWDDARLPRGWTHDYRDVTTDTEAADQAWVQTAAPLAPGLIIDWGLAPRAWHQWGGQPKPVVTDTGGLPGLADLSRAAGSISAMTAEDRHSQMLGYEERALAQAIARTPEAISRAFEDRRKALVQDRPGQALFRRTLMAQYAGACCVTGCNVADALEAAHIIPFAEGSPDRDRASNGLLLRRDIHRLFDLLLLSINPDDTTLWLAPQLRGTDYAIYADQSVTTDAARPALREHFARARDQTRLAPPE